jgi:hypothetical protein
LFSEIKSALPQRRSRGPPLAAATQLSAVVGSIVALISEMRLAGNQPRWACSSMSCLLGAT